jgi:hypothetical protein
VFFGGGLAGGKIRTGKLSAGGEKGFSRPLFSPPARSSPALIFPPASPPQKTVCHAGHASRGSASSDVCPKRTKYKQWNIKSISPTSSRFSQISSPFYQYWVHLKKIILQFIDDVVQFFQHRTKTWNVCRMRTKEYS